jgi:CRP-like cAMP-binding protein
MNELENNDLLSTAGVQEAYSAVLSREDSAITEKPRSRHNYKLPRPIRFDGFLTNKLLTALPGKDFARLLPYLEPVSLLAGHDVYEQGRQIASAYFPETAVISHVHPLADGSTTEAALIGNEGVVGLSAILDSGPPAYFTQVTVAGTAVKVSREVLKREFAISSAMQSGLLKYLNVLLSQLSQRAVCNGCHRLDERLSTWLLMLHDRSNGRQLPLTHETIAYRLGARRAGVTSSCSALRTNGIIQYRRGLIRILNRAMLERAACECYQMLRVAV